MENTEIIEVLLQSEIYRDALDEIRLLLVSDQDERLIIKEIEAIINVTIGDLNET